MDVRAAAPSLSAAGRDRLRKYLAKFGLEWNALKERLV